ncbi:MULTISPECIES: TetR/AcrR family transcriptional regulator [unclassified Rhodococcus (in: high G+C Gram-positive bacteria)]|uniref:TetR/AcrR family transcriptional regulator n=1 Tax=unclassified Rhodococcus (in: high G+C Gram-positive bacteria) TaxID=192944 RepID=UPI00163AB84A|nr:MULTISPECIES: TetR/AcrR family transcriptional regulator [unclassified Rhodococcus (in: high G+C Gram-positive bacteria)]MBC2642209.1 TetR/AcrR family transcriptional regulator [Rhodococcus sp. 3A]MBC2893049.1 TetR/AcrR family transcriptional regulator [Rhodococcus sp. 4CII]
MIVPKIVDHDERRLVLADAVLALIAREGISAVTTRAVAEESGWSTGVLNHYFRSRHELLLAALRRAGDLQGRLYREILDEEGTGPIEKLRNITASILPLDERRLAMTRVFLFFYAEGAAEETARGEIAAFLARWRGVVHEAVVDAQRDGTVSADLDADAVTLALVALTDGLALQAILDPVVMEAISTEDAAARCVEAAVRRSTEEAGAMGT